MSIVAGNNKLHIEYGTKEVEFHSKGSRITKEKPFIKCVISAVENEREIVATEVTKHHEDIPNRINGRTFAIKQAIEQLPTREERKALWNEVNNKFKLNFT